MASLSLLTNPANLDVDLDTLFKISAGPARQSRPIAKTAVEAEPPSDETENESEDNTASKQQAKKNKKRKRKQQDEEIEGLYLQRLAREEQREHSREELSKKKPRLLNIEDDALQQANEESIAKGETVSKPLLEDIAGSASPVPQHEVNNTYGGDYELEKASRTVFLGNVSVSAIKSKTCRKTLLAHLKTVKIDVNTNPNELIESLRFRSTAYAGKAPKKASFARKELMEATARSTNAYAVYNSEEAAQAAANQLNGSVVLDRHLRVDLVAKPANTDHRRCVFVGNLGFVDDDSQMNAAIDENGVKKSKKRMDGDVEEGLWRQFGNAGAVESVRVVRDPQTRVGKGFAYVQFTDENAVEAALLFHDKKFPPLLPRKLRVVRAKRQRDTSSLQSTPHKVNGRKTNNNNNLRSPARAHSRSLLGRAGDAVANKQQTRVRFSQPDPSSRIEHSDGMRRQRPAIFEGHRASSKEGNRGLRMGASKKKGSKRGAKRAAAWKAKSKKP